MTGTYALDDYTPGVHIDMWMHTTVSDFEYEYFQQYLASNKILHARSPLNRWRWSFIIEAGELMGDHEASFREWLEGLSYVRLVVVQYVNPYPKRQRFDDGA